MLGNFMHWHISKSWVWWSEQKALEDWENGCE